MGPQDRPPVQQAGSPTPQPAWTLAANPGSIDRQHSTEGGMCRAVWRCGLVMAILLALAPPVGAEDAQPDLATQTIPPAAAATILGHLVLDHAGEEVGPLVDLLVSRDGQPLAAVIDAGGFLGLGVRRIAVAWKLLRFTSAPDHIQITENLSLDELAAAPEYAGPDGSVIVVGRRPGQP